MGNPQINQPGFFRARNDFNWKRQHVESALNKQIGISGLAQSVGCSNTDITWLKALQSFCEHRQTL
ncbi:Uncharacterised protein [Vibrio cholerae]|nr:Uncharacterised protein [Vibrio cholerae]CSD21922.1 Uncharacterised protein [Vibrio cholerae]